MNEKILVAYASKYGATKEIATRISEVLQKEGLPSEVLSADATVDPGEYRAVILGSAIYVGKWQNDAVNFLHANVDALARQPVWIFASGPTGEGDPLELIEGKLLPAKLESTIDQIHPREVTVFHGNINPEKVNSIEKWAVKSLVKKPFGDYRDWKSIVDWGNKIADALKNGDTVNVT